MKSTPNEMPPKSNETYDAQITSAADLEGVVRIGISGWRYPPWRGVFYPRGLTQDRELEYASRAFPTIEINGTFYSLQRPESFQRWYQTTPSDFVFSVKGPRYITHILRLRDIEPPLANFFASGLFNLRHKLGPILWQFPPSFRYDRKLMEAFFAILPPDTAGALSIARRRERRMSGRVRLAIEANRKLQYAIEIRHESFIDRSFIELLDEHNIALVVADTAGKWPYFEDLTADFVYMRLHGDEKIYSSGYTAGALQRWSKRIRSWQTGSQPKDARLISQRRSPRCARNVYCYFDNDIKVKAPFNAIALMQILSKAKTSASGIKLGKGALI